METKSKHTPGSWEVVSHKEGIWTKEIRAENGTIIIAGTTSRNARLIAAAPELFNALVSAIKLLERDMPEEGVTSLMVKQFKDIIAKAKGE